ncbi:MAG TPA: FxsA family protein [Acidimicrobiia bacterium]|nr:FxsA family protein [Acidimicrobiia bacterium]
MVALLLLLAFLVVPVVELYVIVAVGQQIGVLETLLLMVVVSLVGAWLAKHEGFWVLRRIREQIDQGRVPTDELIDGALVLSAGLLLLTPGFVTDVVGIVALFPPTRAVLRAFVRRRIRFLDVVTRSGRDLPRRPPPDDVIDV